MYKYFIGALLSIVSGLSHATLVSDSQGDFLSVGGFMDIAQVETTATVAELNIDVGFYNSLDGFIPRGIMAMDVDNNASTGSVIDFSEFTTGLPTIGAEYVVDFSFRQAFGEAAIYQTDGVNYASVWNGLDSGNWSLLGDPINISQLEFLLSMTFDNTLIADDGNMDFIYFASAAGFPNINPQDVAYVDSQVSIPEPASILLFISGVFGLRAFIARRRFRHV